LRVVVIGGGLSGLFTASELLASGVDEVVVVDEAPAPGGVTRTVSRDGFSVEPGAGSFALPHPHLGPILDRAGVGVDVPAPGGLDRFVYSEGRLVTVPSSPAALLAPLIPWTAKARAAAEPLIRSSPPGSDESLDAFCRRRLGRRAGELLSWLMASGVFAGDPRRLSTSSAFSALAALETDHGSLVRGALRNRRRRTGPRPLMHTPRDGMSRLATDLAGSLDGRYRANFAVESIRLERGAWVVEGPETVRTAAVVLAVRPERAAGLLEGEIVGHLRRVKTAPVVVAGIGGADPAPFPPGFGVLIGPGEGMATLGVLLESSYTPSRAPEGSWLVKVIAGGAANPSVVEWDDERLHGTLVGELEKVFGVGIDPTFSAVLRHQPGIPQYEVGHGAWLEALETLRARLPELHLTGWGYRGAGVGELAADAVRVAAEVSRWPPPAA
jgi:oxygen-dependent protoporphyrinogen oxidase